MPTLKLPTRLATVLGALYGAVLAYSTQLHISSQAHQAIIFAGVILAALGIHPTDTTTAGKTTPAAMPVEQPPPIPASTLESEPL